MPELGEVAHVTKLLASLVGKQVTRFTCLPDPIVFPSPPPQLNDSAITGVGRHGKYFWIVLANKIMLMHLGMTGWIKFKQDDEDDEWPPKYMKFELAAENVTVAFTDPRRLARVRFIDEPLDRLMQIEPLVRSGSDFSKPDRMAFPLFSQTLQTRKLPIKALLLDQSVCAGIGNWMADEILFQSRIHPLQKTNTLSPSEIAELYAQLCAVSELAVATDADEEKFPNNWLMKYRWSKRKKDRATTAEGYVVDYITVGGRTSCFVPVLQKLRQDQEQEQDEPAKSKRKRK